MSAIGRRVVALATAAAITLGGAGVSATAAADPVPAAPSNGATPSDRGAIGIQANFIPGSVFVLGTANAVAMRSCPSMSCAQSGSIGQNIGAVNVCYLFVDGVIWDLVFRPNGGSVGWIPNAVNHIYNQGGGTLTANRCDADPAL